MSRFRVEVLVKTRHFIEVTAEDGGEAESLALEDGGQSLCLESMPPEVRCLGAAKLEEDA